MSEVSIVIREAIPSDAAEILSVNRLLANETDFLSLDKAGMALTVDELAQELGFIYESPNNTLLIAKHDEIIVGLASIKADSDCHLAHAGEVGISIVKAYWGMGLGQALLQELIDWAKSTELIFRLYLTVQVRNTPAIKLYEKFSFKKEGRMEKAFKSRDGAFIDLYLMAYLI